MSERFLLDTNIISEIVKQGRDSVVLGVIAQVGEDSICTSAIVASERRFGVERKRSQALREKVERVLRNIEILPYNAVCSQSYGIIRAALEREGRGIGPNDLLIAAQAHSLEAVMDLGGSDAQMGGDEPCPQAVSVRRFR